MSIHRGTLGFIVENDISCIAFEEVVLRNAEEAIGKIDAPTMKREALKRAMYSMEQPPTTDRHWNIRASEEERERDRPRFARLWKNNLVKALGVLAVPGDQQVIDKLLGIINETGPARDEQKLHESSQKAAIHALGTVCEPRQHGVKDRMSY